MLSLTKSNRCGRHLLNKELCQHWASFDHIWIIAPSNWWSLFDCISLYKFFSLAALLSFSFLCLVVLMSSRERSNVHFLHGLSPLRSQSQPLSFCYVILCVQINSEDKCIIWECVVHCLSIVRLPSSSMMLISHLFYLSALLIIVRAWNKSRCV